MGYVQKLAKGYRQLAKPLPPLLVLAPSGHGKTRLAGAIAMALGTNLHTVFASAQVRPTDLHAALRRVNFGDLFFVDEAHALVPNAQESLYSALDEYKIPTLDESGRIGQQMESIAAFTLCLGTNSPGKIRKALRSRAIQLAFEPYSDRELTAIAQGIATRQKVRLSPQAARRIAATAQGTPRLIYQRFNALAFFAPHVTDYTSSLVRGYLESEGIDKYGLTSVQRNYLRTLARMPKQRCNLEHLAVRLGLDARFIREESEFFLVERGYIEVLANNARQLTVQGNELLQNLK